MITMGTQEGSGFTLRDQPYDSLFVQRVTQKLQTLPFHTVRQEGIWRDRSTYFLNISYPSMQAMKEIDPNEVFASETYGQLHVSNGAKEVALYVHIPFCTAECYYCHYYKQFGKSSHQVNTYVSSISDELAMYAARFGGLRARSIYIGGGTPSYLNLDQIERLFTSINRNLDVPPSIEVSFEVHPESGTDELFHVLRGCGVNRINIGIESFDDTLLKAENRRHTSAQAAEVFHKAQAAGFQTVNLDLIYGLKSQTIPSWESSLDMVANLRPSSTTLYYLRLKKGTPEFNLWVKYPSLFPSDEDLLLMHAMNFEKMEGELSYLQCPVDWFIKDASHFHTYQDHNWRRSDETELLGVGASAYSYVNGWQFYNLNDTLKYQEAIAAGTPALWRGERLEGDERMRRTIMLGIKMGMDRESFERTYGVDVVRAFLPTWERLARLALVGITPERVDLTYLGKLFADEVGQQFYSDPIKRRMAAIDPALVSTTWPQFNP
jgi:oxygen-independent coproporphyrinogen III oxidase